MPMIYMLIAVNGDSRSIVCHYDNRSEAEDAMSQESFWIDQGMYDPDDENTVLLIEEIEVPETENI